MARRYLIPSDRRRVAIGALKHGLFVGNAGLAFADLGSDIAAVARAGAARLERNVGILHPSHIRVLRYTHMTDGAVLVRVILVLMIKFQRISRHNARFEVRRGQAVTAGTVVAIRLNILVVARKTGRMRVWSVLEKLRRRRKAVRHHIRQRL